MGIKCPESLFSSSSCFHLTQSHFFRLNAWMGGFCIKNLKATKEFTSQVHAKVMSLTGEEHFVRRCPVKLDLLDIPDIKI